MNGTIQKTIQLTLKTLGLDKTQWEIALPVALSSIRSLLCTPTDCVPHDRLFAFQRSSIFGSDLPEFLLHTGRNILHRRHLRTKGEEPTETVKLVETLSPHFARVEFQSGRIDTVSTRNLAPYLDSASTPLAENGRAIPDTVKHPEEDHTKGLTQESTLETSDEQQSQDSTPATGDQDEGYRTRYGRIIKAPERYQS